MVKSQFDSRIITTIVAVLCVQFCCPPGALSSSQSEYDEGIRLYKAKQYVEASKKFWNSITQGNSSPHAWLYVAHSMAAAGNKGEAIRFYRKITTIFKGSDADKMARQALAKLDPAGKWTEDKDTSASPTKSAKDAMSPDLASLPDHARIFYRDDGGDIMLSVRINGRPIEMELDTGAPEVVLDKEHIKSLGIIPPKGPADGQTGGAANSFKVEYWNMPASVQVGTIKRNNMTIQVMDKMETHPLIGQDFFKDFDYTIDRKAQCLEIRKKGTVTHLQSKNYSIPFEFREGGSRIVVQVEINGKKGPMMFDTGNAASGVGFDNIEQMKKWGLTLPEDARLSRSTGVTGSGQVYRFEIGRVKLGPIEKTNVHALVHTDVDDDEDLPLLGQEMWEGWQYTIDMKNKQIHFLRR